jgi:transglutaminase-like putative cysteine protease
MKFSVTHSTMYQYDRAVQLSPHVIRLRPRNDGSQRLLCYDLRIEPAPALRTESTDHDGNVVTSVWFQEPVSSLAIHSRFQVETLRENPFDFLLTDRDAISVPLQYPENLRAILGPYAAEKATTAVEEFARSRAETAGWKTIGFVMELSRVIAREFRPIARAEGLPRSAAETLQTREGACRDFAALYCSACRAMGLAARFVSGYEREAAHSPEHAYMHAWAEVYLPGGGWRGFDPSRGLAVGTSHVPVAAAIDPEMATPISGTYQGPGHSTMQAAVQMEAAE